MKKKVPCCAPQLAVAVAVFSATLPCLRGQGAVNLWELEKKRVVAQAEAFLNEPPETVTAFRAERSAGGIHDFFSEGDYWCPDPTNEEVIRNFPIRQPILWFEQGTLRLRRG